MLETMKNRFLLQDSYLVMFLIAVDDLNYNNRKILILALKGINDISCEGAVRLHKRFMDSALNSGATGLGSRPSRGDCVVVLGKTLYSHSNSLYPGV